MISSLSSRFPQALDDDDDDVAWALQTAQVQWKRGAQPEAIVWLRRAADSADQLGLVWRASDLRRSADELTVELASAAALPPASRPPASSAGSVIDDLLGDDDDGLESIDVSAGEIAPDPIVVDRSVPLPSYASVDDSEFEEDVMPIDDDRVAMRPFAQETAGGIEDDGIEHELDESELEDADSETSHDPVSEPNTDRDLLGFADGLLGDYAEDQVTQTHAEGLRFGSPSFGRGSGLDEDPRIGDVILGEVRGLEDLPPEGQVSLVRQVLIEKLNTNEEVTSFGLALVLRGAVDVMPTIADVACARASKGEIVWSRGHLEDGVALRLVAVENSTEVAVWEARVLNDAVRDLPWMIEDLKTLADRYQALAGVAMGPMGERLDDALRSMVTGRCEVKRLLPGEGLVEKGKPVGGMYIIAAGRIEIVEAEVVEGELVPGDFLFASQVLSGGAAPHSARAGKRGALVLFAGRQVAHELLLSVPPLLEVFAG